MAVPTMTLAAAVGHWLSIICVNWVAVTIVVAYDTFSIDRAPTARVTTDVGVTTVRAATSSFGALR